MNDLAQFAAIMFMLSVICERVAEFFKNLLPRSTIGGKKLDAFGDTLTKFPPGSPRELRRHYRILKLNLCIGFLTAFLCHASLFDILGEIKDPSKVIGWDDKYLNNATWTDFYSGAAFVFGCFFTGTFISLGSKFWHDMLDLVLAIKNVKKEVTAITTSSSFDSLSGEEQVQLLTDAIRENKESWKNNIAHFKGVSIGDKRTGSAQTSIGQISLRFMLSSKGDMEPDAINAVPPFVFYKGFKIPTDTYPTGVIASIANTIPPGELPRPAGSSIGRQDTRYSGTLGLKVKLKHNGSIITCGLSCYHVLFPEELKQKNMIVESDTDAVVTGSPSIWAPSQRDGNVHTRVGRIVQGKVNKFMDIAFFTSTDDFISASVFEQGMPKPVYFVTKEDEHKLEVKIYGRTSGLVTGKVNNSRAYPTITYFRNEPQNKFDHDLEDVIELQLAAAPGDSGSAVLTKKNELIGILVASDGQLSYVVPATSILNNFTVQFITQS